MNPITLTQLRTLTAIHTLTKQKGYPPTRNEHAIALDCTPHNAAYSIDRLHCNHAISVGKGARAINFEHGWLFIPIKKCPGGMYSKPLNHWPDDPRPQR
jgi:hypothetical protein